MTIRLALLGALGGVVFASAAVANAETVVVSPDDETVIREYIVSNPVDPVDFPGDYKVVVGSAIPDTVTVTRIESPKLKSHLEYVRYGDQILLVDPDSRQIIDILEKQ